MRITWIVDGRGWGHDNQSREISKRFPEHDHSFVSRKRGPNIGGNRWIMENHDLFLSRILKSNPDVIVAMHPGQVNDEFEGIEVIARMGMKSNGSEVLT